MKQMKLCICGQVFIAMGDSIADKSDSLEVLDLQHNRCVGRYDFAAG